MVVLTCKGPVHYITDNFRMSENMGDAFFVGSG